MLTLLSFCFFLFSFSRAPAKVHMIRAAKTKNWRVPYAYSIAEVEATAPKGPIPVSPIRITCPSTMKSIDPENIDNIGEVGVWCNCDMAGKPVRDEAVCTGKKNCLWNAGMKYCKEGLSAKRQGEGRISGLQKYYSGAVGEKLQDEVTP